MAWGSGPPPWRARPRATCPGALVPSRGRWGGSSPGTGQGRGCVSIPLPPPTQSLCPHRPTWAERSPPGGVWKVSCLVKTPLCCTNAALSWEFSLVKKQFFEMQPLKKKKDSVLISACLPSTAGTVLWPICCFSFVWSFLASPYGMRDTSCPSGDQTHAPCV